ncbi:hypothetical protein KC357_g25 [Hortaea werneckii]|nr:hypothetical protein KC357_g25 [Hortaea werneckii]
MLCNAAGFRVATRSSSSRANALLMPASIRITILKRRFTSRIPTPSPAVGPNPGALERRKLLGLVHKRLRVRCQSICDQIAERSLDDDDESVRSHEQSLARTVGFDRLGRPDHCGQSYGCCLLLPPRLACVLNRHPRRKPHAWYPGHPTLGVVQLVHSHRRSWNLCRRARRLDWLWLPHAWRGRRL